MTARVDPRLLRLRDEQRELRAAQGPDASIPPARVLITFSGDVSALRDLGFRASTVIGDVATGWIAVDALDALAASPDVESIEPPTDVTPRLNKSVPDIHADQVHTGAFHLDGTGVIVGVIDTGIDIYHQCFRKDDGTTRILAILDRSIHSEYVETVGGPTGGTFDLQWNPPGGTTTEVTASLPFNVTAAQLQAALEALPSINPGDISTKGGPFPATPIQIDFLQPPANKDAPLAFITLNSTSLTGGTNAEARVYTGRELSRDEINTALAHPDQPFPHKDEDGHGTHVAGTAAGDGSQAEKCESAFKYVGVAPGADILMVKTSLNAGIVQGLAWIREKAQQANQPAVVNISLGSHYGDHDGTGFVARAIDRLLNETPTGFAVVVAAGNERDDPIHAHKDLAASGTATLSFDVPGKDKDDDDITLSYPPGAARVSVQVSSPNGSVGTMIAAGASGSDTLERSVVTVSSSAPTASARGVIQVNITPPAGSPGDKPSISSGTWKLTLKETAGTAASVHAWIKDTDDVHAGFVSADRDPNSTITTIAASRNAISVGAYQPGGTNLADFSSAGPTSDGRIKPDVAAPGQAITAPRSKIAHKPSCCDCCHEFYLEMQGTSMASPHVAGVVALMFQRNRLQRFDDVKRLLVQTARRPPGALDGPGTGAGDNLWGGGRIDALAAVNGVAAPAGGGGGPFGPHILPVEPVMPIHVFTSGRIQQLIDHYTATPFGQRIALLVSDHVDEVYRLINTNRYVATCWHRLGGPQLVRQAMQIDPDDASFRVPMEVDGRSLRAQITRMLRMLDRFGSDRLRADVVTYGPLVLSLPGASLDDFELVLAG